MILPRPVAHDRSPMRRPPAIAILLLVAVLSVGCATMSLLDSVESLIEQAKALLDARRFDEALAKLSEVMRRDPTQWKAYLYSAQAYIGKLDWTAALTNIRKARELAPSDGTVLTTLGESLFGAGRAALQRGAFGESVTHFVEYVKLRPGDAAGYLNAGRAYLGNRNWGDAARVLVDGLGRVSDPAARQELARTLLDGGRQALTLGEHRGTIALLREYVRLEPGDVAAYLELGKAYWNSGERSDALGAFRRVLELAPQNEEARRFLLGR
jgi:tetratricopeptide (TPR) repeat protein